jgi:hypothetical protein
VELWEALYGVAQSFTEMGLSVQKGPSCGTVTLYSSVQLCTEHCDLLMP